MVDRMDSPKREILEKRLIRWLLIAALALLICVLGLRVRQLLRSDPVPDSGTLSEDAAPTAQATEPCAPPAADNVSSRKTALIEEIQALDPSLSADDLSALTEEELQQLCKAGAPGLPVGLSAAARAVEEYAGTLELDSVTWDAEPELDEAHPHYEVELHHITLGDFDYEVDAYTGEILKGTPNILQSAPASAAPKAGPAAPSLKTETSQPSTVPADSGGQNDLISEEAAKAAAFAHAGVREEDAVRIRCHLDLDDGLPVYEVEFDVGRVEYEYEIDAATGTVLKAEADS